MSDTKQPISVAITGPTNTGKTAVAVIIEKALNEAGFTDVTVDCMDGDAGPKHLLAKAGKFPIPEKVLEYPVLIQDNNGRAPFKGINA